MENFNKEGDSLIEEEKEIELAKIRLNNFQLNTQYFYMLSKLIDDIEKDGELLITEVKKDFLKRI